MGFPIEDVTFQVEGIRWLRRQRRALRFYEHQCLALNRLAKCGKLPSGQLSALIRKSRFREGIYLVGGQKRGLVIHCAKIRIVLGKYWSVAVLCISGHVAISSRFRSSRNHPHHSIYFQT